MGKAWGNNFELAYQGWTIIVRRVGNRGEYSAEAYNPRYPSLYVAIGPISGRGARTQAISQAKSWIDVWESEFLSKTQEAQS
jgi:hypothetical protein